MSGEAEIITWDQHHRTFLELRRTMDRSSEGEVSQKAWGLLKREYARYWWYRYNSLPPGWDLGAFVPPLISLEDAAGRITGKRYKAQALASLEEFLRVYAPWLLEEARERGGLSEDFCTQMKEEYQKWRSEAGRERKRQAIGKLRRKKNGKFRAAVKKSR